MTPATGAWPSAETWPHSVAPTLGRAAGGGTLCDARAARPVAPAVRDRAVCSATFIKHLARARGLDASGTEEGGRRGPFLT